MLHGVGATTWLCPGVGVCRVEGVGGRVEGTGGRADGVGVRVEGVSGRVEGVHDADDPANMSVWAGGVSLP